MKEMYFDQKTIVPRGLEFLKRVARIRDRSDLCIHQDKTALLILDMQKYFLHSNSHAFIPSAPAIVPYLSDLIQFFKNSNLPVFFTRHLNDAGNWGKMKSWWSDVITPGNPLSVLHESFNEMDGAVVIKSQYDAFFNTDLEQLLRGKGIQQLVIGGVMTHLCCETTARSGFIRGFDIVFGIDFTATYNTDFHLSSLLNISHGFGVPVLFDEVMEELKSGTGK